MAEQSRSINMPMCLLANLDERVVRPPGVRQAPQFKPTGRNNLKPARDFLITHARELIMRGHKSFGSGKARILEEFAPQFQASDDFFPILTIELKRIMMAAMLDQMKTRI